MRGGINCSRPYERSVAVPSKFDLRKELGGRCGPHYWLRLTWERQRGLGCEANPRSPAPRTTRVRPQPRRQAAMYFRLRTHKCHSPAIGVAA